MSTAKRAAPKAIGAALLAFLIATVAWLFVHQGTEGSAATSESSSDTRLTTLTGVIGSEKKPFFDDPRVQAELAAKGLKVVTETAGSRQIATETDLSAYDFAFPSSAPAAQKIQEKAKVSTVYSPFYSPMALATFKPVIQLLARNGVASQTPDGVWHLDMSAYLAMVDEGKRWNQLDGAAALYNSPRSVLISSTDVRKSNSAAMYLSMAAYVLNGDNVVTSLDAQKQVLPQLTKLFLAQGFSASSSEEPFQDYLTQGSGALPMVMIYEAQFVGEAARTGSRITEEMVLAYPEPTVFSKHTLIPLTAKADALGDLLSSDPVLTQLEAEYGFRTANPQAFTDVAAAHQVPVQADLIDIAETPSYDVLESLITAVTDQYDS